MHLLENFSKFEDKIIMALHENRSLTIKQIFLVVNKNSEKKVSYQAIHKAMKNLYDNGVLFKELNNYSLHFNWLNSLKKFSECYFNEGDDSIVFSHQLKSNLVKCLDDKEIIKLKEKVNQIVSNDLINNLNNWYHNYYDEKNVEEKAIFQETNFKNKKILEVGCGTGRITKKLLKKAKHVTAIDNSRECIDFCKKTIKSKKVDFIELGIKDVKILNQKFDIILTSWIGLSHFKDKKEIIENLHDCLNKKSIFLVIDAFEESEYVQILNLVEERKHMNINNINSLKKVIFDVFGNINEKIYSTEYKFPNYEALRQYFIIELQYEGNYKWTEKMEKKLSDYVKNKKNLRINEMFRIIKSIF
jgi:ubiquinone/menaquinone biosynthesis C-methylase UbiE